MSLVSAGNGLCICLIMYLFILRMKLVLLLVFVQVLELVACAISSPFRTYHDFYDWEMWRPRDSQSVFMSGMALEQCPALHIL